MLSSKEKAIMKIIYYDAIKNNGKCFLRPIDILKRIPYKYTYTSEEVSNTINALQREDYFEYIRAYKKDDIGILFILHKKGEGFDREILSEKRAIYRKIYISLGGIIGTFIITQLLRLISNN